MKTLLALVASCVAFVSEAQFDIAGLELLKRANPNELAFLVVITGDNCDVTQADADEVVAGVLTRSRIKALSYPSPTDPFILQASIGCLPNKTAFTVDVDFVGTSAGGYVRVGVTGYSGLGAHNGDASFVLNGLKKYVEDAITDYLKANFDL